MGEERLTTSDIADRTDRDEQLRQADEAERTEWEEAAPLLPDERMQHYRSRWSDLQPRFVDDPQKTVSEADELVAELMQDLAQGFSEARSSLEEQWSRGDDVSTEELRVALQRYRSFFERLLAA